MPRVTHINEGTAFEIINVTLAPGEKLFSQVSSLVCCDGDIKIETFSGTSSAKSGFFNGLKKMIGGESFFSLEFTNISTKNQDVTISPNVIGDVLTIDLSKIPGNKIITRKGSYFAHYDKGDVPIEISTYTPPLKSAVLQTGFLQSIKGTGVVFVSTEGFCMEKTLSEGESFIVDSQNLFMYPAYMNPPKVEFKGFKNLLFGGDGLFVSLSGPGTVYVNTHNVHNYVSAIVRENQRE